MARRPTQFEATMGRFVYNAENTLKLILYGTSSQPQKVQVPFMITAKMRADLGNLGYSPADVNKMTPVDAHTIIEGGLGRADNDDFMRRKTGGSNDKAGAGAGSQAAAAATAAKDAKPEARMADKDEVFAMGAPPTDEATPARTPAAASSSAAAAAATAAATTSTAPAVVATTTPADQEPATASSPPPPAVVPASSNDGDGRDSGR